MYWINVGLKDNLIAPLHQNLHNPDQGCGFARSRGTVNDANQASGVCTKVNGLIRNWVVSEVISLENCK